MALILNSLATSQQHMEKAPVKRARPGHTKPRPITEADLIGPSRLRVGHLMTLFSIAHSTLYERIKRGELPPPDGKDGKRPYWLPVTIRKAMTR